MFFNTLHEWLDWQESLHPRAVDLGLERVRAVLEAMRLDKVNFTVLTVGGTNGKGSCAVFLESVLSAAGYAVGAYLSPHLVRYNERILIRGVQASDEGLCGAFEAVERARRGITLTYFEFGTLAALDMFRRGDVDVAVLEVGMGGRLDAVNAVAPAAAIVTSIGIDHREWLGNDREAIGFEKAGIYRRGLPALCGDRDPPRSLLAHARASGANLLRIGHDFDWKKHENDWSWRGCGGCLSELPYPRFGGDIQLDNAATAIAALRALHEHLPVSVTAVRQGLARARLPGRLQHAVYRNRECIFDVAHNPDAARALASHLRSLSAGHRAVAVFGVLRDKAVEDIARILDPLISGWYLASLGGPRGLSATELAIRLRAANVGGVMLEASTALDAFERAVSVTQRYDRIIVCGSFHTVGPILEYTNAF